MYKSIINGNSFYIVDDKGNRVFPIKPDPDFVIELDEHDLSDTEVRQLAFLMADILNWDNGRAKNLFTSDSIYLSDHTLCVSIHHVYKDEPCRLTQDQAAYVTDVLNLMPFVKKGSIEIKEDVISWDYNQIYKNQYKQEEVEYLWDQFIRVTLCMLGFYSPCDNYDQGSTVYPVKFACPECGSTLGYVANKRSYMCTNKSCSKYNKQLD